MTAINPVTDFSKDGELGIITLNSPPVNALSAIVRDGICAAFKAAIADTQVSAIVLICDGRTFIAGADISEFGGVTKTSSASFLDVQNVMENSPKPVVAAIHGSALGGGLEVALCAHYRIAVPSARCGLPEVHLGLLPGAGGTQRLPRLVGVEKALEMTTSGQHVLAQECLSIGLVDALAEEGHLKEGALAFARKLLEVKTPLRRVRDINEKLERAHGHPEIFSDFRKANARKFRGFKAPESNIRAIEAAVNFDFDKGYETEQKLFAEAMSGAQSIAQRYYFFAERLANKIPDLPDNTPLIPIKSVGVIGAGTMGGGIAMNFLNIGIPVTLVEMSQDALDRGIQVIRSNYERSVKSGRFTTTEVDRRMAFLKGTLDLNDVKDSDLVIEAVYERMDIKKDTFKRLDAICKPGAIMATNTSALNIDEIAAVTTRPESVIGMHFFSPANVMKLIEVVRAEHTSNEVIATIMKLAKSLGKIACLVGVAPGFVGNRMLYQRQLQAEAMLMQGALPWEIDRALYDFGFPMGPFAIGDLAGLDLGWVKEQSKGSTIREILCEAGRRGQKTGAGFYDYDENRNAIPSPFTEQVIKDFMQKHGKTARAFSAEEILERSLYPMINEGAKILEEKKAIRPSDIDVIWVNGYGWPVYRGGPMHYADQIGLPRVLEKLKELQVKHGDMFKPSNLIEKLVAEGKSFSDLR